jgi:hypothetical protein
MKEHKIGWLNIPGYIPETWICIDTNGDHLAIGEDFTAAETKASYPVCFYRLQRVANTLKNLSHVRNM